MHFIDRFLNTITMYRLLLYSLLILSFLSIIFGFLDLLPYSGVQFLALFFTILISTSISQFVLVKLFRAIMNLESFAITGLILFLVLAPIHDIADIYITIAACALAIASKFLFAINRKHFFNPVAISLVLLGIFGYGNAIWWVGSKVLLPFFLIFGFLIIRKIRRITMFTTFFITAIATISIFNLSYGLSLYSSLSQSILSWPVIFFGTVMLTEPLTTPPQRKFYLTYAIIVGILFGSRFQYGPIHSTPELALVLGNIFSYIVSPKGKPLLKFLEQRQIARGIFEYDFTKPANFSFLPGQYMEWTLPSIKSDSRGNRRYFTLASSPTEETLKLGIKVPTDAPSTFKQMLQSLQNSDSLMAGQLSGDFVLPSKSSAKLVWVAGGIGVTPFRSMAKFLADTKQSRDIVLFYICSSAEEFAYKDIFAQAASFGLKTVYVVSDPKLAPANWSGEVGRLNQEMFVNHVPNFNSRTFYLSGPNAMVEAYKDLLHSLKISPTRIVTDYFPGF